MNKTEGKRRKEGGYALALTALLLIPLMAIAAIGVDIGVWYLQGAENQRIADSAALAGAVWMPDQQKAEEAALTAVALNGLSIDVDSTVGIQFHGSDSIQVEISTKSDMAFSAAFIDEFSITRSSVAQYIPPLEVGSPESQLGEEGLWLAISGECSVRENGDLRAARTVAAYPGGNYPPVSCDVGIPNPDYRGHYLLAVTIEERPAEPVTIQVYDGTFHASAEKSTDLDFRYPSGFNTAFSLYDAEGPPFGIEGHDLISYVSFGPHDAGTDSVWTTIGTIVDPEPGIYYIKVSTESSGGLDSVGSNGFAVRAYPGAFPSSCSTISSDPNYSASCPQVSAVSDLSLYASLSGGSSELYLAEVREDHAGKGLEVSLFDVGEGAERIEIIDPDGNPFDFTWTSDCDITVPSPGCAGSAEEWINPDDLTVHSYTLDVSGVGNQVYADTLGDSTWNDRTVVLSVDIPNDYADAYAGRWWRVRYYFGDSITDRTTWSVRVIGDPVRLTG